MEILKAQNVCRTFGTKDAPVHVLHDVSVDFHRGQSVAIVGKSGCGKSTLLHILAGIDLPTSGQVYVEGRNLAALDDEARTILRRQFIGLIFQAFNLLPNISARDNVALPLVLDGCAQGDAASRATSALERVGLKQRIEHLPSRMSGGEQQRVAIARALVTEPKLLLADEPTGNLDSENSRLVTRLLYELCAEHNMAMLIVTHDLSVSEQADRIIHMVDGRIASDRPGVSKENK